MMNKQFSTMKRPHYLFQAFLCLIFFQFNSAAPLLNSSITYNKFLVDIKRDKCVFPDQVVLPFPSSTTFEYLETPLKVCNSYETRERAKEASRICSDIFNILKNITCHDDTKLQLPAEIKIDFSEDVCTVISSLKFPPEKRQGLLIEHLTDKDICDLMCDAEFKSACQVLLWSYQVQQRIVYMPKEQDKKRTFSNEMLKKVDEAKFPESIDKLHTDVDKNVSSNTTSPSEEQKLDPLPKTKNLINNNKDVINNVDLTTTSDSKKTVQSMSNDEGGNAINEIGKNTAYITNVDYSMGNEVDLNDNDAENKLDLNEPENGIENKFDITADDNNAAEENKSNDFKGNKSDFNGANNGVDTTFEKVPDENRPKIDNAKDVEENMALVTVAHKNNQLQKESDNEGLNKVELNQDFKDGKIKSNDIGKNMNDIGAEVSKGDNNKLIESDKLIASSNVQVTKEAVINPVLNHDNDIQSKNNQLEWKMKPALTNNLTKPEKNVFKEVQPKESGKKSSPDKVTIPKAPTSEKTLKETSPVQSENTIPLDLPKNKDAETVNGGKVLPPITTADLEKMEEENEIPAPVDKDQDRYNDMENESEYSKLDYDGDDFDTSLKNKKINEEEPAKLPEPVADSDELAFKPRNSIRGGMDEIQMLSPFPEQEDSHFFFYFFTIILILMAGYLIFHNKQKILALIVEGRHERRRRSHGVGYKKLETK